MLERFQCGGVFLDASCSYTQTLPWDSEVLDTSGL